MAIQTIAKACTASLCGLAALPLCLFVLPRCTASVPFCSRCSFCLPLHFTAVIANAAVRLAEAMVATREVKPR